MIDKHIFGASLMGVLLFPATMCQSKTSAPTYEEIKTAFATSDFHLIGRIRISQIGGFPEQQRNNIALMASETLSENDGASICTRLLRDMAEARLITTPEIIPPLIKALESPFRDSQPPAFYALKNLTFHRSGSKYWGQHPNDPSMHKRVVNWWKEWLKKNHDRHPILDTRLEERARIETERVSAIIATRVKPNFKELSHFSTSTLRFDYQHPLYHNTYDPRMMSMVIPSELAGDFWLSVQATFATPDLPLEIDPWGPRPLPQRKVAHEVQEIFTTMLRGTDIQITVQISTDNHALAKAIRDTLKKEINTE